MPVIWKLPLGASGLDREVLGPSFYTVAMPRKAQILTAQIQDQRICLWILCDPRGPTEERCFLVAPTGVEVEIYQYIATVQDGPFVWHVFETWPPSEAEGEAP